MIKDRYASHMWSYQHEHFTVHQLPVMRDNYIYLIEAKQSDALIAVDPAEAVLVRRACKSLGKPLTHILNTHHHWDHTDGNKELKKNFNCQIIGAVHDASRIPAIDSGVCESKAPLIDGLHISVLDLPGHTSGHIAYLIDDALFCGDTLFGAGCGRLFEGTYAQMWDSLNKLAALAETTKVYCAHEYTLANLAFAQTIDTENTRLTERFQSDQQKRSSDQPTIPSTIAVEKATNPMLRPLNEAFCAAYASRYETDQHPLAIFTAIRQQKDQF